MSIVNVYVLLFPAESFRIIVCVPSVEIDAPDVYCAPFNVAVALLSVHVNVTLLFV